jgi:two-component system sensor histidine kinase/response regulator
MGAASIVDIIRSDGIAQRQPRRRPAAGFSELRTAPHPHPKRRTLTAPRADGRAPDFVRPEGQGKDSKLIVRTKGMDRAAVLERVEGDVELLKQLVELFREDSARHLSDLRAALERGDVKAIERSAHALKGSTSNFGAPSAWEAALRLETLAHQGGIAAAKDAFRALEREVENLSADLTAFTQELGR